MIAVASGYIATSPELLAAAALAAVMAVVLFRMPPPGRA